jgi:hypothetical protein
MIRTYTSLYKPELFIKDYSIDFLNYKVVRKEYIEKYLGNYSTDLKYLVLESID